MPLKPPKSNQFVFSWLFRVSPYLREASPTPHRIHQATKRLQMCWRHVEVVEVEIRQGWILKAEDQPNLEVGDFTQGPWNGTLTPVLED